MPAIRGIVGDEGHAHVREVGGRVQEVRRIVYVKRAAVPDVGTRKGGAGKRGSRGERSTLTGCANLLVAVIQRGSLGS